jgi:hypothetical protein
MQHLCVSWVIITRNEASVCYESLSPWNTVCINFVCRFFVTTSRLTFVYVWGNLKSAASSSCGIESSTDNGWKLTFTDFNTLCISTELLISGDSIAIGFKSLDWCVNGIVSHPKYAMQFPYTDLLSELGGASFWQGVGPAWVTYPRCYYILRVNDRTRLWPYCRSPKFCNFTSRVSLQFSYSQIRLCHRFFFILQCDV